MAPLVNYLNYTFFVIAEKKSTGAKNDKNRKIEPFFSNLEKIPKMTESEETPPKKPIESSEVITASQDYNCKFGQIALIGSKLLFLAVFSPNSAFLTEINKEY